MTCQSYKTPNYSWIKRWVKSSWKNTTEQESLKEWNIHIIIQYIATQVDTYIMYTWTEICKTLFFTRSHKYSSVTGDWLLTRAMLGPYHQHFIHHLTILLHNNNNNNNNNNNTQLVLLSRSKDILEIISWEFEIMHMQQYSTYPLKGNLDH